MKEKEKRDILKKLDKENLIKKKDISIFKKPFKEDLKNEIRQNTDNIHRLYLEKILLEEDILFS